MRRVYCTIFNTVYLVRGLALAHSLRRYDPGHRLYVFAIDEATARAVEREALDSVVVVRTGEFETAELKQVKPSRSIAEYFWTCTPQIVRHCMLVRHEPECTYVDADVWLLSDPGPLIAEMGNASVLLTEHRYSPRHDQSELSGRFCVQFMRFVNNENGLAALNWWCDRCIEWCYARREDGKFGDQKYLDDWAQRFQGIHVSSHVGAGVAPWNLARTRFRKSGEEVQVSDSEEETPHWRPLVFFHFHSMMSFSERSLCLAFGYRIPAQARAWIYLPYVAELQARFQACRSQLEGLAARSVAPGASNSGQSWRRWARRIWGLPNTVRLEPAKSL